MSTVLISCAIGYFFGCLSPSWAVGKLKQVNIRNAGSGNLGATNVFLHVSKAFGLLIMVFDIFKSVLAIQIVRFLFAGSAYAPALAGAFAIIGHIYPFYLKFQGGKGSACLVGTILGLTPRLFVPFVVGCILIGVIANYLCVAPLLASSTYPIVCGLATQSLYNFFILAIAGVIMVLKHRDNIIRMRNHTEPKVRNYFDKD
ncbi:MAG: glycerol-3-phosphate acyltransferase [Lachnospiraceae bacterium]|nr:glycerol-3-phosphate acyltransferase [Lachnospiraceae bacterium]